jgi:hypothetical protein
VRPELERPPGVDTVDARRHPAPPRTAPRRPAALAPPREKGIALLQLDGSALAPEGIWGGGGLIHFVGRRKSLRKRRFGKVAAFMTYT